MKAYRTRRLAAATMVAAACVAVSLAQNTPSAQNNPQNNAQVKVLPVRGNIYMLSGAGGNITASVGDDGVLLVDSGLANMSDKVLAALHQLSQAVATKGIAGKNIAPPKPVRFIINTHAHADHYGGNEKLGTSGKTYTGGNVFGDQNQGAQIYAHENTLNTMSTIKPALPVLLLPTDTYHVESMNLSRFFNGEAVQLLYQPAAHTDGDSLVYFRASDVLATGDIFTPGRYPYIDLAHGGSINGLIASLTRILDIAVPEFRLEGGTYIVPGHGRLTDIADAAYYRDAMTIIRDRIQDAIQRGLTLGQVQEARLTLDYDGTYGATTGFVTTDKFVEAVYKSLSQKK